MSEKMRWDGIGPKLALITLPYIALVIVIMNIYPDFLKASFLEPATARIIGGAWFALGLVFYAATFVVFMRDFKKGGLMKTGTYGLCRNPIYASFIIFFLPALAIFFESWLLLSTAFVLYLNFKLSIHGETLALKRIFGTEFEEYQKNVMEIVPIPKFWQKKA